MQHYVETKFGGDWALDRRSIRVVDTANMEDFDSIHGLRIVCAAVESEDEGE